MVVVLIGSPWLPLPGLMTLRPESLNSLGGRPAGAPGLSPQQVRNHRRHGSNQKTVRIPGGSRLFDLTPFFFCVCVCVLHVIWSLMALAPSWNQTSWKRRCDAQLETASFFSKLVQFLLLVLAKPQVHRPHQMIFSNRHVAAGSLPA